MGSGYVAVLAQAFKQVVFEFTTLVVVDPLGKSKTWDEIVEQAICCCLG